MNHLLILALLASLFVSTLQRSIPSSSTYIAAVVEFDESSSANTAQGIIDDHARQYVELIKTQSDADFDIIVFPEDTLNHANTAIEVPHPNDNVVPCGNDSFPQFLKDISCAARDAKRYVVINLSTKQNCSEEQKATGDKRPCHSSDWNLYNTNIVFDRNGKVISKYRKFNLFETDVNKTLTADLEVFDTDFGVKFGSFVCFDILFVTPALDLIRDKGIRNIVYPTKWFSELPFLTAVQIQQNWAFAQNINLLAAGASAPLHGSTGSGIYSGRQGALASQMSSKAQTRLLIKEIPKIPIVPNPINPTAAPTLAPATNTTIAPATVENRNETLLKTYTAEQTQLPRKSLYEDEVLDILMKQDHIKDFTFVPIATDGIYGTSKFNLCQRSFCCDFFIENRIMNYNADEFVGTKNYKYYATVSDSERSFDQFGNGSIQMCSVIACTNGSDFTTCAKQYQSGTNILNPFRFESIAIKGRFDVTNSNVMPTTLTTWLTPQNPQEFAFTEGPLDSNSQSREYSMTLNTQRNNLLTFGIYSLKYSSGSSLVSASMATIMLSAFYTLSILFNRVF